MEGLRRIGVVPDEVLLLCGRPDGTPSGWWTPSLAGRPAAAARRLVATAASALEETGVRDPADGRLRGALGAVATIVEEATVALLIEVERPGHVPRRRSVLAAGAVALFDLQLADGMHELTVASAPDACALLAGLLDGLVPEPGPAVDQVPASCTPEELASLVPEDGRTVTVRIVRVEAGSQGAGHLVTVVADEQLAVTCWARPDGRFETRVLDADSAVDLALLLLGAQPAEVVA